MSKFSGINAALGETPGPLRVLVAPLDWGLGHATRCVPVICALQEAGHQVWLAGEGAQEQLLRGIFPGLPFLPLKGYRVRYGRSALGTTLKLITQLPRLRKTIREENRWLAEMQQQYQFQLIISDNRFGLHHPAARCVFLTHQLWIIHPWGQQASRWLQSWNYRHINRFQECWVPDYADAPGLAGILSHPNKAPTIPTKYLGPLSRLNAVEQEVKKGHLFISLSGPEPQRSLLENRILAQVAQYPGTACIVRGLPTARSRIPSGGSIEVYNHLEPEDYAREMARAETVICRSGYSTLMDLWQMQKKRIILIPTPGQTEQQYLAKLWEEKGIACCVQQDAFNVLRNT